MSRSASWIEVVVLGLLIFGGSAWLAEEGHAQQRVNADRIIILSDEIAKKTNSVTHNRESAAAPNDGGADAPGAGPGSGPGTPATPAEPAKPEKPVEPAKPAVPAAPEKPAKPEKPEKPAKPEKPGKQ